MSYLRRQRRLRRLALLGLAFVLGMLAYGAGKAATCRYLPCGWTVTCPPCPGEPPPDGTMIPILVKPAPTPEGATLELEPTP